MKSTHLKMSPRLAFAGIVLLLFGCTPQPTLQIARLPFVSPVVIPDLNTQAFLLTAAVYNWGEEPTEPGKLGLTVHYNCNKGGTETSYSDLFFDFPALAPGQGWTPIKDRLIADPGPHGPVACECFKDDCSGFVELMLFDQAAFRVKGQNTYLKVMWDKTGNLASMTVIELP